MTYENYVYMKKGKFGGEELTFLDEPRLYGDETLAIFAGSNHKELAWEFIKSRITDEYYKSFFTPNGFTAPFPVTRTCLKMYEEYERSHYPRYDEYEEKKTIRNGKTTKDFFTLSDQTQKTVSS